MYLRLKPTKTTPVLQLVQSIHRMKGTPLQKVIASFGNPSLPRDLYRAVASYLEIRMSAACPPPDGNPDVKQWGDMLLRMLERRLPKDSRALPQVPSIIDGVITDSLEHSDNAMLGPLLPLEMAWRELNLDGFLSKHGFARNAINYSKVCIYNRLLEPVSEHAIPGWVATTAFEELLQCSLNKNESKYYRAGDKLHACSRALEKHLYETESKIFKLEGSIWLYDLTNSYFEGECEGNKRAKRTKNSKENRTDCPIIALGLVLDNNGFPIHHRVYDGNTSDCTTVPGIVEDLSDEAGIKDAAEKPTIVLDGGIATDANLKLLAEAGYNYLVNGKRTTREHFYEDFINDERFHIVAGRDDRQPVMVSRCEQNGEIIILCRSDNRKLKEDAIISKMEEKLLKALEKLSARVERNDGKLHMENGSACVDQAIGSIRRKYVRAAKFYDIAYNPAAKTLSYSRKEKEYQRETSMHGCYHLRTNRTDLSDDEIWSIYITLTRIEASFRSMKSDLGLRPFYHQKDERCETHVLLTVLAYHLQRFVERKLEEKGFNVTFQHVKRLLQTHCYATVSFTSNCGLKIIMRKPGKPDTAQQNVYRLLGISIDSLPRTRELAVVTSTPTEGEGKINL